MNNVESCEKVLKLSQQNRDTIQSIFRDKSMKLIKHQVVQHISDIQHKLDHAHTAVAEILRVAQQEAEQLAEHAYQEGLRRGYDEIYDYLVKARSEYNLLQVRAQHDMVELAFGIAEQILRDQISLDPSLIQQIVASNIRAMQAKSRIHILICPQDEVLLTAYEDVLKRTYNGVHIAFEADASLQPGDCVIETESGRLDARLSTQLEVLKNKMMRRENI